MLALNWQRRLLCRMVSSTLLVLDNRVGERLSLVCLILCLWILRFLDGLSKLLTSLLVTGRISRTFSRCLVVLVAATIRLVLDRPRMPVSVRLWVVVINPASGVSPCIVSAMSMVMLLWLIVMTIPFVAGMLVRASILL